MGFSWDSDFGTFFSLIGKFIDISNIYPTMNTILREYQNFLESPSPGEFLIRKPCKMLESVFPRGEEILKQIAKLKRDQKECKNVDEVRYCLFLLWILRHFHNHKAGPIPLIYNEDLNKFLDRNGRGNPVKNETLFRKPKEVFEDVFIKLLGFEKIPIRKLNNESWEISEEMISWLEKKTVSDMRPIAKNQMQIVSQQPRESSSVAVSQNRLESVGANAFPEGSTIFNNAHAEDLMAEPDIIKSYNSDLLRYLEYVTRRFEYVETRFEMDYQMEDFVPMTIYKTSVKEEREVCCQVPIDYSEVNQGGTPVIEDLISSEKKIVVLGGPGDGKSTLLQYIALSQATRALNSTNDISADIPIFVSLKSWADDGSNFWDYLNRLLNDLQFEATFVSYLKLLAKRDKLLFLLDGLDEIDIPGDKTSSFIEKIKHFFSMSQKCVLTARPCGPASGLSGWNVYNIKNWHMDHKRKFVEHYFSGDQDKSNGVISLLRSEACISELASNPLFLKIICFLYDKKIVERETNRFTLLEKATDELLRIYFRRSLKQREEIERSISENKIVLGKISLNKFLGNIEELSCKSLEKILTVEEIRIIERLSVESGLLKEPVSGCYEFLHQTFYEYFVSCSISEMEDYVSVIKDHMWDWEKWENVLLLLSAKLSDKANDIITMLIEHDDNRSLVRALEEPIRDKEPFRQLLFLAARCCRESRLKSGLRDEVIQRLKELFWGSSNIVFSLRCEAAESIALLGDHELINMFIGVVRDTKPYSFIEENMRYFETACDMEEVLSDIRVASVRALGNSRSPIALSPLIDALRDPDRQIVRFAVKALGELGLEDAIESLSKLIFEPDTASRSVILPVRDFLANLSEISISTSSDILFHVINNTKSVLAAYDLPKNTEFMICMQVANLISSDLSGFPPDFPTGDIIDNLRDLHSNSGIVYESAIPDDYYSTVERALEALSYIDADGVFDKFRKAIEHPDEIIKKSAIEMLLRNLVYKAGFVEDILVECLLSEDFLAPGFMSRVTAGQVLKKIGSKKAVEMAKGRLNSPKREIRVIALEAFCTIGSEKELPLLIDFLSDPDPDNCFYALKAIGEIGIRKNRSVQGQLVEAFRKLLIDEHSHIVEEALRISIKFGVLINEVKQKLLDILETEESDGAIDVLVSSIPARLVEFDLLELLLKEYEFCDMLLRPRIIIMLGEIDDNRVIGTLIGAINDPCYTVKVRHSDTRSGLTLAGGDIGARIATLAVKALGRFNSAEALNAIVNAVRANIVEFDPDILEALLNSIDINAPGSVREVAIDCLRNKLMNDKIYNKIKDIYKKHRRLQRELMPLVHTKSSDAVTDLMEGNRVSRKLLYFGPSGCGKTLIVNNISIERSKTDKLWSYGSIIFSERFWDNPILNLRRIFARMAAGALKQLIIEDLETFLGEFATEPDALCVAVNELKKLRRVMITATTRRPWELQNDVLGIFDELVPVLYPDRIARREIIKIHYSRHRIVGQKDGDNLDIISEKTQWFTGLELVNLVENTLPRKVGEITYNEFEDNVKQMCKAFSTDERIREFRNYLDFIIGNPRVSMESQKVTRQRALEFGISCL